MNLRLGVCLAFAPVLCAQDAEAIMARVAKNQDASREARTRFVYQQTVRSRMMRTNGKPAREETRVYTVTPAAGRTEKKLASFRGAYGAKGKLIPFDRPGSEQKATGIDAGILEGLTTSLIDDQGSRDGIQADLFPLSSRTQAYYSFHKKGEETVDGRPVWRIAFEPKERNGEQPWRGEALIDREEFEPVSIYTVQAFHIPFLVKTMLGTNVRQMGFQLSYRRISPGIWFPVSYGTEFRLDVLFAYKRVITMSLKSSEFREASVSSQIEFELPAKP